MRMGGPICWGCMRETQTMSLSSCESEIYATNEGTKREGVLDVCLDPVSTVGGAINLAPHLGGSSVAVAAAARAVVAWASSLANYSRSLH
jgi:hypothetical protein